MAIIYFTNNANSGTGSLRAAISAAQPGDVIRPDETVFERGSTIEIVLASTLTVDKNLTLDGGPFRVRLNGGGARRCASVAANVTAAFVGFDFVDGCLNGGVGGGINAPGTTDVTFERCGFYGCSGKLGGGAYTTGTTRYFDCVFSGCLATESGGGIYISKTAELNGVTIAGCVAGVKGGALNVVNGTASAANSIICGSVNSAKPVDYTGCVVDVASSEVGFVASPPDGLTVDNWNANAWQDWDLRLLDDASGAPSSYRDSGDVGKMSRYDFQGNFRGRETNSATTCSPGAYETIQADLFWIGEPFPQEMVDAAPQNVRITNYRQTTGSDVYHEADMTWEIPDGAVYSKIVAQYKSPSSNGFVAAGTLSGDATGRTSTQLREGSRYIVRVRGVFENGDYTAWAYVDFVASAALDDADGGGQTSGHMLPSPLNVVAPSFLKPDGWATSRFATTFSESAPSSVNTLFIGGNVSFADSPVLPELNVKIGGGRRVALFPDAATVRTLEVGAGAAVEHAATHRLALKKFFRVGSNVIVKAILQIVDAWGEPSWSDVEAQIQALQAYAPTPTAPRYGTLAVGRISGSKIFLDGVYECERFQTLENASGVKYAINVAPGTTIRCKRFDYTVFNAGRTFASQVDVKLYGDATATVIGNAGSTLDVSGDFTLDVTDATNATLKLTGQTVYGAAPTAEISLTGSAKVDARNLDVASLALNADSALTVENAEVNVAMLTLNESAALTVENADVNAATLTLNADSALVVENAQVNAETLNATAGSALNIDGGRIDVATLTLNADSTLTIGGGRVNVATLTLGDGAEVAFSPTLANVETGEPAATVANAETETSASTYVDAILTARDSATVGAAAFAGVGYFATPPGTDLTAATFAETVRVCDFGADVKAFAATATGPKTARLEWSANDAGATVCVERENAAAPNGWETIAITPTAEASPLEVALSGRERFRIFDGASFTVDSAWFAVKSFYVYSISSTQKEVASYSLYSRKVQMVRANIEGSRNENVLLLAQIKNLLTGEYLTKANTESIVASVYKVEKGIQSGDVWTESAGWNKIEVPLDTILETPTMLEGWTNDEVGANFIWTPNSKEKKLFAEGGKYVIQITFNLIDDNPIVISFNASVK